MLGTIGKIGRVDQAEGHRRQHLFLLAPFGDVVHQRGGVPLAEVDDVTLRLQPLLQQRELRALARSIDPFDDEQPPRKAVFTEHFHA